MLLYETAFIVNKLHKMDICHGDINPKNIIVTQDYKIKIRNF